MTVDAVVQISTKRLLFVVLGLPTLVVTWLVASHVHRASGGESMSWVQTALWLCLSLTVAYGLCAVATEIIYWIRGGYGH